MHDAPQRQTPIRRTARAFTATTLVVLAASLLQTAPAQAAPGDLDSSFSGDGRRSHFGGDESGSGVAVQADGKLVVAVPRAEVAGEARAHGGQGGRLSRARMRSARPAKRWSAKTKRHAYVSW